MGKQKPQVSSRDYERLDATTNMYLLLQPANLKIGANANVELEETSSTPPWCEAGPKPPKWNKKVIKQDILLSVEPVSIYDPDQIPTTNHDKYLDTIIEDELPVVLTLKEKRMKRWYWRIYYKYFENVQSGMC